MTTANASPPLRVLFLASRDWKDPKACGGDLCTTDFARYLARRGHQVTLLVSRYPGSSPSEALDGVRIVRPGGLFFLALRALLFYLRHGPEFDALYEEGMASLRLPFLAPLYARRPLVSMWYQVNEPIFYEQYPRPIAWLLTRAERAVLRAHGRCTLLTLSAEQKAELVARGVSANRIELTPPLMLGSRPEPLPEGRREPLVVWLGKLRRYKCAHHAIEALPDVLRAAPDARLVIAGRRDDVDYEAELLALARRLGVGGAVELRVNISEAEKWDLLGRATALAVTSPVEGFGIVIVEANRCGTPVVATEGVPVEVAEEGSNALRVAFGDSRALAAALQRLLSDRALFDELSRGARQHAERFSADAAGLHLERTVAAVAARAA